MVILDNKFMSDDKKTTKEKEEKPKLEKIDQLKEEEKEESVSSTEGKTVLEEVVKEAKPKKGKKGKLEHKEIKPEEIRPGMIIRVHQKIADTNSKGEEKERIQVFQGMVLAKKHGKEAGGTITVRKVSEGIGVEKIFPLNMPAIEKIELVRTYKVKQAKPYYLRTTKKKLTEIKD